MDALALVVSGVWFYARNEVRIFDRFTVAQNRLLGENGLRNYVCLTTKILMVSTDCSLSLSDKVIPRQLFEISIQAAIGKKIIARENLSAYRADVTAGLYGGMTP